MDIGNMHMYLPKNIRIITAAITLVSYLITTGLYATCYNQIDDNGLEKHRVFTEVKYTYGDVEYYQLYARSDGTLGLFFRLRDGSKIEYYDDVMSYNVDDTDEYIIEVIKKLDSLGVKCRVILCKISYHEIIKRICKKTCYFQL